jgi:flagellar FliL protein
MSENAEPTAEGEAPPKKSGPKGVVLIGTLVGGLVAGVAAGLFAVGPMVAKSSGYVVTASAESEGEGEEHASGEGEEGEGEHGAPTAEGKAGEAPATALHMVDNLVLNPAGSGGTRFLMLSAVIELGDSKLVDQFKARDAEVRDVLLRVVGSKTVEQLSEMTMRDPLRQELSDSLSQLLPKKERKKAISRVFFPQFVIQ